MLMDFFDECSENLGMFLLRIYLIMYKRTRQPETKDIFPGTDLEKKMIAL
jgi:hypothetical protein